MKKCDKCNKIARVTQDDEELCLTHYNLSPQDEEETKTKDKEIKDDYILL